MKLHLVLAPAALRDVVRVSLAAGLAISSILALVSGMRHRLALFLGCLAMAWLWTWSDEPPLVGSLGESRLREWTLANPALQAVDHLGRFAAWVARR
jgi:hypothetical protein